ncbi:hypothetical protein [Treponema sp.]|uniref:hypothetical protein n=1 Tax=Treponema sp. TaxID=166 RepID=UPI00298DEC85|nr:hypothetical protein [Treponema sp.]MCR5613236.1 hypothetical protein [Treponema sp.]
MNEIKEMKGSIDNKTEKVITAKSGQLFSGINNAIKTIESNLHRFSAIVCDNTTNVEKAYKQKIYELKNFHIGAAVFDFVVTGIICFLFGIVSTLIISQKSYAHVYKLISQKELQLSERRGMKKYREELIESNSGIIKINELRRDYIKKHKSFYMNPDESIKSIDAQINDMKKNPHYQD